MGVSVRVHIGATSENVRPSNRYSPIVPANTDHSVFKQPSNPDIKVWCYMDFAKYVSLLDKSALWFSRSDKFDDRFEGSTPYRELELRRTHAESLENPQMQYGLYEHEAEVNRSRRQWIYVNCWHMNENESAAMWRLYASNNEAVAIQSTYALLCDCLPSNVYLGEVRYIDYTTESLPDTNIYSRFLHKRRSFEHERELRAVIDIYRELALHAPEGYHPYDNDIAGVPVDIPVGRLLERVYVAPTAPTWFRDLVETITVKYNVGNKPVIRSSLEQDPVY